MMLFDFETYPFWIKLSLIFFLILDFFLLGKYLISSVREDLAELVSRILGSNFFGLYLLYRIQMKFQGGFFFASQNYFEWLQWLLIVFPFFVFFWSYLFRLPAKAVANRFREIIFPFWVALLPFGVYESNRLAYIIWIRKTEFL